MSTIAKTKRYRELDYRYRKLIQLYAAMSELRLHTNKSVDTDTAKYYHNKLYVWGDFGPFLTASIESMMQVFYIELDGFIGAFWNSTNGLLEQRRNEQGSLAAYLYDGTRTVRKKSARVAFEALLEHEADELKMIHDLRGKLAHFKKLDERCEAFVPGDVETREILNKLAKILYLLGFQRWNRPHYIEKKNNSSVSTQKVVAKLVFGDEKGEDMRKAYIEARDKWFEEDR